MPFNSYDKDIMDDGIDLTPLIDTVFLLLIFFIMASTFSKPVLDVILAPSESAQAQEQKKENLIITITNENIILFNDEAVAPENVKELLLARPADESIVFNIDKEAAFGTFVTVLDTVKMLGRESFTINAAVPNADAS